MHSGVIVLPSHVYSFGTNGGDGCVSGNEGGEWIGTSSMGKYGGKFGRGVHGGRGGGDGACDIRHTH